MTMIIDPRVADLTQDQIIVNLRHMASQTADSREALELHIKAAHLENDELIIEGIADLHELVDTLTASVQSIDRDVELIREAQEIALVGGAGGERMTLRKVYDAVHVTGSPSEVDRND